VCFLTPSFNYSLVIHSLTHSLINPLTLSFLYLTFKIVGATYYHRTIRQEPGPASMKNSSDAVRHTSAVHDETCSWRAMHCRQDVAVLNDAAGSRANGCLLRIVSQNKKKLCISALSKKKAQG